MLSKQKQRTLISPADIRRKALSTWQRGDVLKAYFDHHDLFPLNITFRKPTATEILNHFQQVGDWIHILRQHSKSDDIKAYRVDFSSVSHRQLGEQALPSRIYFETLYDFLGFIQKKKEFDLFQQLSKQTLHDFPSLNDWLYQHPHQLLKHADIWLQLIDVCRWFCQHPQPKLYIRELDIEGVDSKFIERHRGVLSELLSIVLPQKAVNISVIGLSKHGFERRFGLKYDQPLIRFRYLSKQLSFSDISVPLSQFLAFEPKEDLVFITENKVNGLSFPAVGNAMVLFGLGYGIEMLKDAIWLKKKHIVYWGDIDSHGFAILSQLRSYFPHVSSLCMDENTLIQHKSLWGKEPDDKRCEHDLEHLTTAEKKLFQQLQRDHFDHSLRLEQERIRHTWLQQQLKELQC